MNKNVREQFGIRLTNSIAHFGRLCVGIDPSASSLKQWNLTDSAGGAREYSLRLIEAAAGHASVIKPQSAYFERFGYKGIEVLTEICLIAKESELLVLLDAKRGDIGSTNMAYADAYLRTSSPIPVDALTVTPYTGVEALMPLIETALEHGSGLFVLVRTSNPEGQSIQIAKTQSGIQVSQQILREISEFNKGLSCGSIGCVFGATIDPRDYDLANLNAYILSPGIGTQGATVEDLKSRFKFFGNQMLPTASRSITRVGPNILELKQAISQLNSICTEVFLE